MESTGSKFESSYLVKEFNYLSNLEKEELLLTKDAIKFIITDIKIDELINSIIVRKCFVGVAQKAECEILDAMPGRRKLSCFKLLNDEFGMLTKREVKSFLSYANKIKDIRNDIAHKFLHNSKKHEIFIKNKEKEFFSGKEYGEYLKISIKLFKSFGMK
jgi:hypothetical protein